MSARDSLCAFGPGGPSMGQAIAIKVIALEPRPHWSGPGGPSGLSILIN